MIKNKVFLFGESEKGEYGMPILCKDLGQLIDKIGHPPEHTQGVFYAIQTLLYGRELIFFRVEEEGYSLQDYCHGLECIKKRELAAHIQALCLPGVGDRSILTATDSLCQKYHMFLIVSERDFYDYLTDV